jgi:hypothetical protein
LSDDCVWLWLHSTSINVARSDYKLDALSPDVFRKQMESPEPVIARQSR